MLFLNIISYQYFLFYLHIGYYLPSTVPFTPEYIHFYMNMNSSYYFHTINSILNDVFHILTSFHLNQCLLHSTMYHSSCNYDSLFDFQSNLANIVCSFDLWLFDFIQIFTWMRDFSLSSIQWHVTCYVGKQYSQSCL